MTFPSSGSGYPQQGGVPGQQPQGPGSGGFQQPYSQQQQQSGTSSIAPLNLGVFLALAVTLLGLVNYFISFSGEAVMASIAMRFLLIGGLLAALRILPKGPKVMPFAALASVLGALLAILVVVRVPADVPGIVTVLLILGILQMLVAVAALLIDYEVVKLPVSGGGQQPPYSQPFPAQPGGYAQQAGQTQSYQPTQYGPPITPANQPGAQGSGQPSQQPTQYAAQQGQFFPQQAKEGGEAGQQGNH